MTIKHQGSIVLAKNFKLVDAVLSLKRSLLTLRMLL